MKATIDHSLSPPRYKKLLKCFQVLFVYILNTTFMETNTTIIENQVPVSPAWGYTAMLAFLFVDICDYIGLPVNIPSGLLAKKDEAISYSD